MLKISTENEHIHACKDGMEFDSWCKRAPIKLELYIGDSTELGVPRPEINSKVTCNKLVILENFAREKTS